MSSFTSKFVTMYHQTNDAIYRPEELLSDKQAYILHIVVIASYSLAAVVSLALLIFVEMMQSLAYKGDLYARRKVLLPALKSPLWLVLVSSIAFGICISISLIYGRIVRPMEFVDMELMYSGQEFALSLTIVYVLQPDVAKKSVVKATILAVISSMYIPLTLLFVGMYSDHDQEIIYHIFVCTKVMQVFLFVYVIVRPPLRGGKRALREFCILGILYIAGHIAYFELFRLASLETTVALVCLISLLGALSPIFTWRVFHGDTRYWRQLGRQASNQQNFLQNSRKHKELISTDGSKLRFQIQRKHIFDFSEIQLKEQIGIGYYSKVYKAILKNKTSVAVKAYAPIDFTEDTIARFAYDAALCIALNHPNIGFLYGMCIYPPSICFVYELCQGSLVDVTSAIARRGIPMERQQFLINIGYMLDAARAIAYLHSFSPPLMHNEITPHKFVIEKSGTVKLSSMGQIRQLTKSLIKRNQISSKPSQLAIMEPVYEYLDADDAERRLNAALANDVSVGSVSSQWNMDNIVSDFKYTIIDSHESYFSSPFIGAVQYLAPEVVKNDIGLHQCSEAADVYSLAVSIWYILNAGGMYSQESMANESQQITEQRMFDGFRPKIPRYTPLLLRQLLQRAWETSPQLRPSAQTIVSTLEVVQEEHLKNFMDELVPHLIDEFSIRVNSHSTFSGAEAIAQMRKLQFIFSESEGIRIGNALMEIGVIHHVMHKQPFVNRQDSRYYISNEYTSIKQSQQFVHDVTNTFEFGICKCRTFALNLNHRNIQGKNKSNNGSYEYI